MGRNAGGVNGASGLRGATERGYTTKMLENIVGKEREYRSEKIEYAHIYIHKKEISFLPIKEERIMLIWEIAQKMQ